MSQLSDLYPGAIVKITQYGAHEGSCWAIADKPASRRTDWTCVLVDYKAGLPTFAGDEFGVLDENDRFEIAPDDEIPDHVWRAYGEWLVGGEREAAD